MDTAFLRLKKVISPFRRGARFVYHRTHWFTDQEAWALYRLFAFVEAIGWTLLISAIVYRKFDLPLSHIFVSIAGTVHGLFFGLYFLFVFLTARSMLWGPWRVSFALVAGMPPYTAVIFEQYMARHRKKYPRKVDPPKGLD